MRRGSIQWMAIGVMIGFISEALLILFLPDEEGDDIDYIWGY